MMSQVKAWAVAIFSDGILESPAAKAAVLAALLAGVGVLARLVGPSPTKVNSPHYQWDTGVSGSAKKRWMWDSLKLLREGYSKVSPESRRRMMPRLT